jgi:hypothetical protein
MSVGGEPLRLGGVEYRKGLGIHARTVLEYELGGDYATFLARVGIHDGLGAQGAAAVEVLGDGASLASGVVRAGGDALEVSVRIAGVRRLRIETDFGEDGHGLGDQVDWAEARVVKDSRRAGGDDDRRNAEAEGEAEAEEPREQ